MEQLVTYVLFRLRLFRNNYHGNTNEKNLFIVVKLHNSLKILSWYEMHIRQLPKRFKMFSKKLTICTSNTNANSETNYFISGILLN